MDDRTIEMDRFTSAIDLIRKKFPKLHIEIGEEEEGLHASAFIEEQPGLDFEVNINLQNCDELNLCAETLWGMWSPVGEEGVFEEFIDAVFGLLSGDYRIVEHRLWGFLIGNELQKPYGDEWQTIYTISGPSLASLLPAFIPLPRTRRYFQNRAAT